MPDAVPLIEVAGQRLRRRTTALRDGGGRGLGSVYVMEQGLSGYPQDAPSRPATDLMNLGLVLAGRYWRDGEEIGPGILFGMPPGRRPAVRMDRTLPYHDVLLVVTGPAVGLLGDLDLLPPYGMAMPIGAPATAAGCFRRLMAELPEGPCHVADGIVAVAGMMRRLLSLRRRDLEVPVAVLEAAAELLGGDPTSRLSEELLLARLDVPWPRLRRAFTAHHGLPPHRYRIRWRIAQACRLLASMPVQKVAERLGYADAFSFSRQFSQWMGVPPSRWKDHPG